MKSAAVRIAHYDNRTQSTQLDPTLAAVNSTAQANYAAHVSDFYPKQTAAAGILDAAGIANYARARYQACNGQFYHLARIASGAALAAEFTSCAKKWIARGCAKATLISIASTVYSVTITIP